MSTARSTPLGLARVLSWCGRVVLLVGHATGCASAGATLHGERLGTQMAIAAAEAMGAGQVRSAADHLAWARAQAELAEQWLQHGQHGPARRLMRRAEADAALALALAREAPARALAQDAVDQLQAFEAAMHAPDAPDRADGPDGPDAAQAEAAP